MVRVSESCLPRGYRGSSWFDLRAYSLHCQDFVGQSLNLPTPAKVDLQSLAKVDVSRMRYGDDSCGEQDNTLHNGGGEAPFTTVRCTHPIPGPVAHYAARSTLAIVRVTFRRRMDVYFEARRNLHEGWAME